MCIPSYFLCARRGCYDAGWFRTRYDDSEYQYLGDDHCTPGNSWQGDWQTDYFLVFWAILVTDRYFSYREYFIIIADIFGHIGRTLPSCGGLGTIINCQQSKIAERLRRTQNILFFIRIKCCSYAGMVAQ